VFLRRVQLQRLAAESNLLQDDPEGRPESLVRAQYRQSHEGLGNPWPSHSWQTTLGPAWQGNGDLADFRSLRLFRHDGSYLDEHARLEVGDVWELDYTQPAGAVAPHLEDVLVRAEGARKLGRDDDLGALVRERDVFWHAPEELFDGCLNFTARGSAYVPAAGPLPGRGTGYWQPNRDLMLYTVNDKPRYRWTGGGVLLSINLCGSAPAEPAIPAGALVRLSLSRLFAPPDGPAGFWLQLSGWFHR
jgi:hypothetical protein